MAHGPSESPMFSSLFALVALLSTCRGERVHFRVHSGDVVDQHTHTRTVLLHPDSEVLRNLRQLQQLQQQVPAQSMVYVNGVPIRAAPQQPVSYMRQTLQLPLPSQPQQQQLQPQSQPPQLPSPSSRPQRPGHGPSLPGLPGHLPVPGLGATHIQQAPFMPIIPLAPIPGGGQKLAAHGHTPGTVVFPTPGPYPPIGQGNLPVNHPAPTPPRVTTKKTQTSLVTHQMSGPGPWPMHMLLPHGPNGELVPMRLVAVAHARPGGKMSAALLAPSAADLKKGKGCKAFIRPGEDPEVGDCFLEEYEKGYNEEHSNKKFYGQGQTDGKSEKQGARNTKRYKNESKFVRHPKQKKKWLRTPDGAHHRIRPDVGPLFTTPDTQGAQRGSVQTVQQARGSNASGGSKGSKPNKVTVVRLPPGATAVTTVLRGEQAHDDQDLDEDDEKALQQDDELEQSLDPQHREEDEGLVEVFKHSARSAPLNAPLVAVSPAQPMWVQEYHPVRIKEVDDDDEFEVEESAPVHIAVSPEMALGMQPRGPLHPLQPRAVDDMDLGWSSGFTDSVFDADEPDEKADMEAEVEDADFDHSMDDGAEDREGAAQAQADDDDGDEQDHAASEINDSGLTSLAMLSKKGPAERMLQRQRGDGPGGPSSVDRADSTRLGDILAATPPAPHPAAFGAKDPDRLESGRKAPVVLEFGHELSGYKVTREREQKKWRRRR